MMNVLKKLHESKDTYRIKYRRERDGMGPEWSGKAQGRASDSLNKRGSRGDGLGAIKWSEWLEWSI